MEIALRLAAQQAPLPLAVYIAGRRPPAPDASGTFDMSEEELVEYAFAPEEIKQTPAFLERTIPLLRKDLELDARIEQRLSSLSMRGCRLGSGVGLELHCGTSDSIAPWSEAEGWQQFAVEQVNLHFYPGGHEFMLEQRKLLFKS